MVTIDRKDNLIRLMGEYQNLLFSICLKMTGDYFAAEDIVQETFLSVYRHLDQFDGANEKAWLCRIASNRCIDYLNSAEQKNISMAEEELPETESEAEDPLRICTNRHLQEELERCCHLLSPPYNRVAQQYFIQGRTAAEISAGEKIPLKTAQTQIYRARDQLKKIYRKEMLLE